MKTNKKIAIVGGGASGLFLSVLLTKQLKGVDIYIYEAQNKVGKKILQTGNGKCNLGNTNITIDEYNTNKISYLLDTIKMEDIIKEFNSIGLKVRVDSEGRIYPYSEKATTVLDILLNYISKQNNIFVNVLDEVLDIKQNKENKFILKSQCNTNEFDYVIMCTGGNSGIKFNNNSYNLIKKLGHNVTPLYPSLCALKTKENTKALSGIRIKCKASIIVDNEVKKESNGELLFKDDGLSGVLIFILSQYFTKDKENIISIDLLPNESISEINKEFSNNKSLEENLLGYFPKMVNKEIVNRVNNNKLSVGEVIKNFNYKVINTYGFTNAQLTKGGVNLIEVNIKTFESSLLNNLYFAGEVLDVDGSCGGFNLYFAFASSYLIMLDIKKKILGEKEKKDESRN